MASEPIKTLYTRYWPQCRSAFNQKHQQQQQTAAAQISINRNPQYCNSCGTKCYRTKKRRFLLRTDTEFIPLNVRDKVFNGTCIRCNPAPVIAINKNSIGKHYGISTTRAKHPEKKGVAEGGGEKVSKVSCATDSRVEKNRSDVGGIFNYPAFRGNQAAATSASRAMSFYSKEKCSKVYHTEETQLDTNEEIVSNFQSNETLVPATAARMDTAPSYETRLMPGIPNEASAVETVFPDGSYSGALNRDGVPHGNFGIMRFADGSVYEGQWSGGHMEGQGKCSFADGGQYKGEWKAGQPDGIGKCTFANGYSSYEGEWKNGMMDGNHGVYYFGVDEWYEGQWKRNQPEGAGFFHYAQTGNEYEGQWRKGKREGNGIFKYKVNGDEYEGEWRCDKKDGIGVYRWKESGEVDIKYYVKDIVQEGIRWSRDQRRAWKLIGNGDEHRDRGGMEEISLEEATLFRENAFLISPFLCYVYEKNHRL